MSAIDVIAQVIGPETALMTAMVVVVVVVDETTSADQVVEVSLLLAEDEVSPGQDHEIGEGAHVQNLEIVVAGPGPVIVVVGREARAMTADHAVSPMTARTESLAASREVAPGPGQSPSPNPGPDPSHAASLQNNRTETVMRETLFNRMRMKNQKEVPLAVALAALTKCSGLLSLLGLLDGL